MYKWKVKYSMIRDTTEEPCEPSTHGGIREGFSEEMKIEVDLEGCTGIYQEKLSKGILGSQNSTCRGMGA